MQSKFRYLTAHKSLLVTWQLKSAKTRYTGELSGLNIVANPDADKGESEK